MQETPKELVGFCESCIEFKYFTLADGWDFFSNPSLCECGHRYSTRIGYQVTTQRTYDSSKAKKLIAEFKKIKQKRLR
tara:strand:+ start:1306 stop:1539 length:234 start_codon:yes stop_codon:yes gene_type:complete